jgi:hypothetical protein
MRCWKGGIEEYSQAYTRIEEYRPADMRIEGYRSAYTRTEEHCPACMRISEGFEDRKLVGTPSQRPGKGL